MDAIMLYNLKMEDKQKQYILDLLRNFKKLDLNEKEKREILRDQIDVLLTFLSRSYRKDNEYIRFIKTFNKIRFSGLRTMEDMIEEFEELYTILQEVIL